MNTPYDLDSGTCTTMLVGPRQYIIRDYSNESGRNQQRTTRSNNMRSDRHLKHSLSRNRESISEQFSDIDADGNERTEIHNIPIVKHSGMYQLTFQFPAILADSITSVYQHELPAPTPNGSIDLPLASTTLSGLLKQYKSIYHQAHLARSRIQYTHFFAVPLGVINPISMDLSNQPKDSAVPSTQAAAPSDDQDGYQQQHGFLPTHTDSVSDTSQHRFVNKFMQSDTAPSLCNTVEKLWSRLKITRIQYASMLHEKQINRAGIRHQPHFITGTSSIAADIDAGSKQQDHQQSHQDKDHHNLVKSIMPFPKLHCTLFLVKILSRDEYERVQQLLHDLGPLLYDSIGGTSISVRVRNIERLEDASMHPHDRKPSGRGSGGEGKTRAIIARLAEVGKDGKVNSSDHVATSSAEATPQLQQHCPRLALVTSLLAKGLVDVGVMTNEDLQQQRIGENGVNCGILWHMTLFNRKYANDPSFFIDGHTVLRCGADLNFGLHRLPCINLYRLGSNLSFSPPKSSQAVNLFDYFPRRVQLADHYTLDASLPLP